MAEVPGIQVKLLADITQLQKSLDEAKKAIASVAQESEKQADKIGNPLRDAADQVGKKYGWLAGELAGKLASVVNPATLAATAVTTLGAALFAYIESSREKVVTLDEVLKRHAQTIRGIGLAYPEAMKGLQQFAAESNQMLQTRLRGDLMAVEQQIKKLSEEFVNAVANPQARSGIELLIQKIGGLKEGVMIVKNEFELFRQPILEFNKSIRDGKPDVDALKRSLDAIPDTTPEVVKLKNEIIALLDQGLNEATGKAEVMREALSRLGAEFDGTAAATRSFNAAIRTLDSISPKQIDNLTRANNEYNEAIKDQNLSEEQRAVLKEKHAAAIKRVQDAEAAAAAASAQQAARMDEMQKQRAQSEKDFALARIENLELSWATQEERLAAHLLREQEIVANARAVNAIDDERQKALLEAAETKHQERMAMIRSMGNAQSLSDLGSFFAGAAALAKSNGDKSFKTAKAFAIAQGLVSTASAAIQAMADPTAITPFQKFANYAAVLGKGLSAIASIRSMSPAGGGGGGGGTSAGGGEAAAASGGASSSRNTSVYVNLQGQTFGRDQVRGLLEQIAAYQKDGGQVVFA